MENPNPEIPFGSYCYDRVEPKEFGFNIKLCPHWSCREENGQKIAHCAFLNKDSEDGDPFNLIWDQVKECGLNEGSGE